MAKFRVRIELNKGRHGIPVHRLAEIAKEAEKFFEMFADDLGLDRGEWIADNFRDGSVGFDTNYVGTAPDPILLTSQKAFDLITTPTTSPDDLKYGLRKETFLQFARLAAPIDADDAVHIGVYNGKADKPEIRELTKQRFIEIEKEIVQTVEQYGGVQGIITALFKESNTFWIRELSTGKKLSCIFPIKMYNLVWKALEAKDAVVNVEGWKTVVNGKVEHLKVTTISPALEYLDSDLEKFFGCDPNFTGNQSTEEFIDDLRGETTEDYIGHLTDEDE
jgi:hypothetical protein